MDEEVQVQGSVAAGGTGAKRALAAAFPVMLGYISIGIPAGILESQIGMTWWMCAIISLVFYTGAGQFMLPNLWMAGTPIASIIASISFVNTRQILYSAAFSRYFAGVNPLLTFLFAETVTDESFGVNLSKFENDPSWTHWEATLTNVFSMLSWTFGNVVGSIVGDLIPIPTAIAAFAMTAIFVCLLVCQDYNLRMYLVVAAAFAGVYAGKLLNLGGAAILVGALVGVAAGLVYGKRRQRA